MLSYLQTGLRTSYLPMPCVGNLEGSHPTRIEPEPLQPFFQTGIKARKAILLYDTLEYVTGDFCPG